MAKYEPNNVPNDPREFDAMPLEEQACLLLWIKFAVQTAKTERRSQDSYGMKHDFQHEGGFYVTNGEFKGAMLRSGYDPENRNAMNWTFKAKPRCKPLHWTQRYYQGKERRDFSLAHISCDEQVEFAAARRATQYADYYSYDNCPWLGITPNP